MNAFFDWMADTLSVKTRRIAVERLGGIMGTRKYLSAWARSGVALVAIVALCGLMAGCARNTNSFNIGGTGMYLQTPVGMIAIGNFESHLATSELSNEKLVVTDTKYFEGAGNLGADAGNGASSTLNTQRSYSMTVTPMEDGSELPHNEPQ